LWKYYVQPETGTIVQRLDVSGKPVFVIGEPVSPSIEDSAFNTSHHLATLALRYELTGKAGAAKQAHALFQGLMRICTVNPVHGLIVRGLHPDGMHYYGNASVDQYTGVFFALWRYYHSKVATAEERMQIERVVADILERLERNQWMIMDENGDTTNVWDLGYVDATRSERLLSFLLIGYDITGDGHWRRLYDRKKQTRLESCGNFDVIDHAGNRYPAWVQEQTSMSLRALLDLAKEPADLEVFREGARTSAESAVSVGLLGPRKSVDGAAVHVAVLLSQEKHYDLVLRAFRERMTRPATHTRGRQPPVLDVWLYYLAASQNLIRYDPLYDLETPGEAYRLWREDSAENSNGTISLR
jgi:hypothetical protein